MATETGSRVDEGDALAGVGLDDPRRLLRGAFGVAGFLAVWYVVALGSPAYVVPSPVAVAEAFGAELASGDMTAALSQSVRHWIPGTVVGTALGVTAGVAFGWSRLLDDLTAPLVRALRPVPPLALIGFAIAWFGINDWGAAFIIAVGAFWINFYAAYGAVEGVSEDLLDVGRTLGVRGDLDAVRSIVLPASTPGIMTGIRTGLGRCWMLVVASEIFGVPGVGREIIRASDNLRVDQAIAYILVLSLMYLLVDVAFRAVERRVLVWRA
ncbi:ABC transporter permease [Halorubrum sp. BOL3-1]|uniref:ABC transporter permease n=1 Tax=Halorubrum sp. BOL3-1 TaxID=2497325 RepID=UPI0010051C97|nr:ABC transporter permease [Halorubrum sp. BOL3-1]QAU13752.1 ABC transporter permease [Halorubrum sp. BOL3-1]